MKKIGVSLLILLLVIPLAYSLGDRTVKRTATDVGKLEESPNDEAFQKSFEQDLQNSIQGSASTIDLSQQKYRANADLVKKVLKDKHNINVNDIAGVKVEAGILKTDGGNAISLTTGKPVTLEIQGNTIKRFEDGETTILNGQGVKVNQKEKEVKRAETIQEGDTQLQFLTDYKDDGEVTTIEAATLIASSNAKIPHARKVTIKKTNNQITKADFICNGENNDVELAETKLNCNREQHIQADITLTTIDLTLDKDITFEFKKLKGKADEDNAEIKIIKKENEFDLETKGTTLQHDLDNIKETLISKSTTKASIDEKEGIYKLLLGINSRFSLIKKDDESKSFFLLNTGNDNKLAFITKPSHKLLTEIALDFFVNLDQTIFEMKGQLDWGTYKDKIPFVILESQQPETDINIKNKDLTIQYTLECEELPLLTLRNGDFSVIDHCSQDEIKRYAGYDKQQENAPLRIHRLFTETKPEITFLNNVFLQIDDRHKVVRMFGKEQQQRFTRNLETYSNTFFTCRAGEDHLTEKTTILDWLQ